MSAAGFQLVAGRIPGERIATDEMVVDSSTFTTTETTVQSVTAPLVAGRTYRVRACPRFNRSSGDAADVTTYRIREDDDTGTELQLGQVELVSTGVAGNVAAPIEVQFTAASTGDKTFVLTGVATATATSWLEAAGNRPAYLYVDYIEG